MLTTAPSSAAEFSCSCGHQFAAGDFPDWITAAIEASAATLRALVRLIARPHAGLAAADAEALDAMTGRITEDLTDAMAAADLEARALMIPALIDPTSLPTVPHVPFGEAVKDVIERHPKLAANADAVADLYREGPAFAMAKSMELNVTESVQNIVGRFLEEGTARKVSLEFIVKESDDFTHSYAETVLRTNVTTAQTEGMFAQSKDPNIKAAIPGFMLTVTKDRDVRRGRAEDGGENHAAAHGLIAAVDDPMWMQYSPPFGYRCRCRLIRQSVGQLRRLGLLREDGAVIRRIPTGINSFRKHPNFTRSRMPGS